MIFNKFILIGAVISVLGAFGAGYKGASWRCDANRLEAVERALEQAAERQLEIDEIEKSYWEDQLARNVKWKTIEKEVVKYVKDNGNVQCLTTNGVSIWNSSTKAINPSSSSD